jgi:hypothetical protein
MKKKREQQNGEITRFEREFLSKPGEHLIEVGITGSGKTQGLYWILDGILKNSPGETIVWFDSGKRSEILTLAKMRPLNIIIPFGTEIVSPGIDTSKVKHFDQTKEIWLKLIEPGKINVICLEPYILEPAVYTKLISKMFKELIHLAHDYAISTPMAVFIDEFHRIAPSKHNAIDLKQMAMGGVIQHNIETLRALEIRFVCTTHGWMKIRAGVRSSFNWIFARRGAHFGSDQPKLSRFNPKFENLNTWNGCITFPTKHFTDPIRLPLYQDGKDLGTVRYVGVFGE